MGAQKDELSGGGAEAAEMAASFLAASAKTASARSANWSIEVLPPAPAPMNPPIGLVPYFSYFSGSIGPPENR